MEKEKEKLTDGCNDNCRPNFFFFWFSTFQNRKVEKVSRLSDFPKSRADFSPDTHLYPILVEFFFFLFSF